MLVQPTDNHKYTVSNITFYIIIYYIYYVLFLAWDNGGSFGNHCGIEKAVGAGSGAGRQWINQSRNTAWQIHADSAQLCWSCLISCIVDVSYPGCKNFIFLLQYWIIHIRILYWRSIFYTGWPLMWNWPVNSNYLYFIIAVQSYIKALMATLGKYMNWKSYVFVHLM